MYCLIKNKSHRSKKKKRKREWTEEREEGNLERGRKMEGKRRNLKFNVWRRISLFL